MLAKSYHKQNDRLLIDFVYAASRKYSEIWGRPYVRPIDTIFLTTV